MSYRPILSSSPRGAFECFPKLPEELKLKIWKEALPGPQVVEVYFEPRAVFNGSKMVLVETIGANRPPSVLFHVSRTSRQIAMEKYRVQLRGFSLPEDARIAKALDLCSTRIDPNEDTIALLTARKRGPEWLLKITNSKMWSDEALAQIKYVAVEKLLMSINPYYSRALFSFFVEFQNLQDFTVCLFEGKFQDGYGRIPTNGVIDWPKLGTFNTWALNRYHPDVYKKQWIKSLQTAVLDSLKGARNQNKPGKKFSIPNVHIKALQIVRRDYWNLILQAWWDRYVAVYGLYSLLHQRG